MEEKTGKADKKEIRSRKNQKLYRSRFGKGGKIMKKLDAIMNGDLDEIIDSLIAADQAAKLSSMQEEA